jgi:hypothetical protein
VSSFKHETDRQKEMAMGNNGTSTSAKELQWMRGEREEEKI